MSFDRTKLPDPLDYFTGIAGLNIPAKGKWRSTSCIFHGGKQTLRINTETGAWVCMSCGVKGGDVLAYHQQAMNLEFVDAAKQLGAYVDDGKPAPAPKPFSARDALEVLEFESAIVAVCACDIAAGKTISKTDKDRVLKAAGRIRKIREVYP
jgi:hypothetical protein